MRADRCELLHLDLPKAEQIRAALPPAEWLEPRAAQMKALADETRLQLTVSLSGTDELCVCDLAWIAGRAENLVSHHLRALKAAGLATSRRDGKMALYALTPAARALLAVTADADAFAPRRRAG